jgi:hypothetical protein
MATPPLPTHPFTAVLCAVGATLMFSAASQFDSFVHGFFFGMGLALLALAILVVARTRPSAPGQGWLPSRSGARADSRRSGSDASEDHTS